MISQEDKIAIYNSKIRRVATLKEVVESLGLDDVVTNITTVDGDTSGITSEYASNVSLIKQGRVANITLTVGTNSKAKTEGTYNILGKLPSGFRGRDFQSLTTAISGNKFVTIDIYENGDIFVVWTTARIAGDNQTNKISFTYFTES